MMPKVQPGQTLQNKQTNKQKIPDSPSSTAPHGNTSFVCCYLCGFNTNCRIILIDPSAFGSITQHKLVQLLPHHCTVFKILLFNKKKKNKVKPFILYI